LACGIRLSPDSPVTILTGDSAQTLKHLPDRSVHCVVTSPPYYGLRDYEVEGQLGLEKTPEEYVANLVAVFREVHRVLRDDGTLWLNIGDSYSGGGGYSPDAPSNQNRKLFNGASRSKTFESSKRRAREGYKQKDLIGVPWMVAFALRADGWYLRSDLIWAKPNPMPESVTDRCTKAHEYLFMFTKSPTYYFDQEAIKEPAAYPNDNRKARSKPGQKNLEEGIHNKMAPGDGGVDNRNRRSVWSVDSESALLEWLGRESPELLGRFLDESRTKGDVWTICPKPYKGAHFACYPPELVKPCVLAGSSEKGVCPGCGAPYVRVVEKTTLTRDRPNEFVKRTGANGTGNVINLTRQGVRAETVAWEQSCSCSPAEPVPATVLDPFGGSGTTAEVALDLGRNAVLCELNPDYLPLIHERLKYRIESAKKLALARSRFAARFSSGENGQ